MARREAPEVNAGSMADIAFLLLIFFLVSTTIETDSGISRKLPPWQPEEQDPPVIKERNIFQVLVNSNNQLLVEGEDMEIEELRQAAVDFIDNGGGTGDEACDFCQGEGSSSSSVNPRKAIISLVNNRGTEYGTYIAVQNELVAAYNQLRDREAQRLFGTTFTEMEAKFNDSRTSEGAQETLKERIELIKDMIPQKLSEAEPQS
ncbi:Biopolymer transport protein ExbD/TolR [Salegentibacter holothuriorum]|uniref:Biopolymer transport protein ExbD/TolR n=1 Tax=Salegentibacter holothuriorum TaxID=241145 RepID=A0A1T5C492_9FLAO|nr:biopolymer transporter ExbD [Salegentibacter holothuriorum]SKB54196.1 Biopolymer transport protein ExbD/TolR [Salegentibacter holothuriorum]